MKISHETPFEMMDYFRENINDYDYALVHLFEYPSYKEFFIESLENDRTVYLDNSIYELGTAFDPKKFAKIAKELYEINSDNLVVIMPDVFDDYKQTLANAIEFEKLVPGDMRKMLVLQGKTTEELMKCYTENKTQVDLIGINHLSAAFGDDFEEKSANRIKFVKKFSKISKISKHKIHLLGVLSPFEVLALSDIKNIESVDTSNPVCYGLEGSRYPDSIFRKPLYTIDKFIKDNNKVNPQQFITAVLNAKDFRALANS